MFNWKRFHAIKQQYECGIGKDIPKHAGIYLWTRKGTTEQDKEITYWYVGQAKNLFNRRWDYYQIQSGLGYPSGRHFESSLKKHKDWQYQVLELCEENALDERERYWIREYRGKPFFITRNENLTGDEIVRNNYKRIENIKTKFKNSFVNLLKHLNLKQTDKEITISVRTNKDKTINKNSQKAFENLRRFLFSGD